MSALDHLPATSANLQALGVGIEHHFGGGVYAKETRMVPRSAWVPTPWQR